MRWLATEPTIIADRILVPSGQNIAHRWVLFLSLCVCCPLTCCLPLHSREGGTLRITTVVIPPDHTVLRVEGQPINNDNIVRKDRYLERMLRNDISQQQQELCHGSGGYDYKNEEHDDIALPPHCTAYDVVALPLQYTACLYQETADLLVATVVGAVAVVAALEGGESFTNVIQPHASRRRRHGVSRNDTLCLFLFR